MCNNILKGHQDLPSVKKLSQISSYERWVRCSNFPGSKRTLVGMCKLKITSQELFRVISGASTVLSLPYPTTDYDSQTRAKLLKRSTKVLQRLNETLNNADLHENFCACSKLFFWTSVLLRSPTITTITAFTSFHTKLFSRNSS